MRRLTKSLRLPRPLPVVLLAVAACASAPTQEVVRLSPRQLPGCEIGTPGEMWLRAQGDFATLERPLPTVASASVDALPIDTDWLALEVRGAERAAGGLTLVQGQSFARDVLLLPFGRACPLGDSAAAATDGAAIAPLPGGGLLIAGGAYSEHAATSAARWLAPGEILMREVDGGMLLRRAGASATRAGAEVFVAGGAADDRGEAHDTFEVYDVASNRFDNARSGKLAAGPRRDHAALVLSDRRVLLVGGRADLASAPLRSTELVGADRRAELAPELQIGRENPELLRLDSGALLVALGTGADGLPVPELERIDLESSRSEVLLRMPVRTYNAVATLPGDRLLLASCDETGACGVTLVRKEDGGFVLTEGLRGAALEPPAINGFTRLRLLPLRDGRVLLAGATTLRSRPRGFVLDLSAGTAEPLELTRGPDRLLELEDGSVAELDEFGLSLLRRDLITPFSEAPDPLDAGAPIPLALDVAAHWQRSDGELRALTRARCDLPALRYQDFALRLSVQGRATLLLEPEYAAPLLVEVGEDEVVSDRCRAPRAKAAAIDFERHGDTLLVRSEAVETRCPLPAALGRASLALEAEPDTRITGFTIHRL